MLKRWWILAALLISISWMGCKKSEGNKVQNFFGAPPSVSEVSVTKERRDFQCFSALGLCEAACIPDTVNKATVSIDLVTASARVVDPTPPDGTNPSDILVVVLRFLDPPPAAVPPGTQINQVSFEMFDSGPITVGHVSQPPVDVYSGDLVALDGIFTRKFYFGSTTTSSGGTCLEDTDRTDLGHTYSTYSSARDISPSSFLGFPFTVQAIDRAGNIDTSSEITLPIQGTFRESSYVAGAPCGPEIYPGCGNCPFTCTQNNHPCGCYPPP